MYKWIHELVQLLARCDVTKGEGRDWNRQVVGFLYIARPFQQWDDIPIDYVTWFVRGGPDNPAGTLTFRFMESERFGMRIGKFIGDDLVREFTLKIGLDGQESIAVNNAMEHRSGDSEGSAMTC